MPSVIRWRAGVPWHVVEATRRTLVDKGFGMIFEVGFHRTVDDFMDGCPRLVDIVIWQQREFTGESFQHLIADLGVGIR